MFLELTWLPPIYKGICSIKLRDRQPLFCAGSKHVTVLQQTRNSNSVFGNINEQYRLSVGVITAKEHTTYERPRGERQTREGQGGNLRWGIKKVGKRGWEGKELFVGLVCPCFRAKD